VTKPGAGVNMAAASEKLNSTKDASEQK